MEKLEPSHYEWECKMGWLLWKTVWQVLKNVSTWPSNFTPRCIYTGGLKTYVHTHTHKSVHSVHSNTIHNCWKYRTKGMFIYWWKEKQKMMIEHYSAIKRNEVLICATTWMNLEHDTSWKKPDTIGHIFHFYDTTRIGKSEKQTSDCQGRGECENDFWWVWDFFWDDENALKLDSGDGCTVMQIHEKSLNYLNTLKW